MRAKIIINLFIKKITFAITKDVSYSLIWTNTISKNRNQCNDDFLHPEK